MSQANFTDTEKAQAWRLIHNASEALGALTDGQVSDLLLDNLKWLDSAHSAHNLIAECRNTPYYILEQFLRLN